MASTSPNAARSDLRQPGRLSKSRRLSRKRLIQPLFGRDDPETKTCSSGSIRLLYRWAPYDSVGHRVPLQVGFAVGRTVGGAVVRNRVKRVLREAYRQNQEKLVGVLPARDAVLTMMVVVRRLPSDQSLLRRDLLEALERLAEKLADTSEDTPARSR